MCVCLCVFVCVRVCVCVRERGGGYPAWRFSFLATLCVPGLRRVQADDDATAIANGGGTAEESEPLTSGSGKRIGEDGGTDIAGEGQDQVQKEIRKQISI